MAENKNISFLKVQVYAGNDAIPIEGAKVVISREGRVEAFLITDEDGSTPVVKLPAPERSESLEPYSEDSSYSYRGDIYAEGFYDLENLYIELVGGSSSTLKVNMIPLYKGGKLNG